MWYLTVNDRGVIVADMRSGAYDSGQEAVLNGLKIS